MNYLIALAIALLWHTGQPEMKMALRKNRVNMSEKKLKIDLSNHSDKQLYYVIGLAKKSDSGWVSIAGDIKYLGQKQILSLKAIEKNKNEVLTLPLDRIPLRFLQKGANVMQLSI